MCSTLREEVFRKTNITVVKKIYYKCVVINSVFVYTDLQFFQIMGIVPLVAAVGVIFGCQLIESFWALLHQETNHFLDRWALFRGAPNTFVKQSVRDDILQNSAFLSALALVQKTVQVVIEESIIGKDSIDVDVIIFAGVIFNSKGRSHHKQDNEDGFHFDHS